MINIIAAIAMSEPKHQNPPQNRIPNMDPVNARPQDFFINANTPPKAATRLAIMPTIPIIKNMVLASSPNNIDIAPATSAITME